jgi:putative heme-binding domain-containing protein
MFGLRFFSWGLVGILLANAIASPGSAQEFEFQPGDRIAYLGNTLPDRMQHDGYLEARLQAYLSELQMSFRNLGFSGDELDLRLRSQDFGSPEEWLTRTRSNVVFAFFGSNEAYAGPEGIDRFKEKLRKFISETVGKNFGGSPTRVVIFSPIAHEDLELANLPSGEEHNVNLELYTQAMAEVSREANVRFVDLYHPTLAIYRDEKAPLTINGIHLSTRGNELLSKVIVRDLLPSMAASEVADKIVEAIRQAVVEKNFYWFQRYRTTDGFSIFGGRADLRFVDGQSNRDVAQREMEVLDVMTANRDPKIWAVAQGRNYVVDDSNTPPFLPVTSNKPGDGPNGEHLFLTGEEALSKMTPGSGMKVNLFASEEMFPELINPVQMAWDTKGRLWVAAWRTYPHWKPKEKMDDKLLILEDTDGDGKADKCTTFVDDIHNPTGFEFWNGGVLVAQTPDLLFLKDTDGDDRADVKMRVLHGLDSADTHHASSSFTLDPGGALYFQEGTFHHTQVETPYGPVQRVANGAVFRYDPRRQDFDIYTSYGFANPHGHVFDRWGQDIVHDGTGAVPYHGAVFSTHLEFPEKHGGAPTVYQQRTRPCSGTEILSSSHFPEDMQGDLLVNNVIGFLGVLRYKIKDDGSSFSADEMEPILSSTDPNFRPADVEVGPDGAIYVCDWHNPIIGHMQHNLRDPNRDKTHGRVYRVSYEGRPLTEPAKIADQPINDLLALLKSPDNRVRYRAKLELSSRRSERVVELTQSWIKQLDPKDPEHEHHMMEALWVHQHHNQFNLELLERMLSSPDFRARAAATFVLCYWRDRTEKTLEWLKKLAADEHPRVRLEAVRAASFLRDPAAIEVVVIAKNRGTDRFLDYVIRETERALQPYWQRELDQGKPLAMTTAEGMDFYYEQLSTDALLKLPSSPEVNRQLVTRANVSDEIRLQAVQDLAVRNNTTAVQELVRIIQEIDSRVKPIDDSVVYDLVRLLGGQGAQQLGSIRNELVRFALEAKSPVIRQSGLLGLIAVDKSTDQVWAMSSKSVSSLRDLIRAMPLISDTSLRSTLYERVSPLLNGLPAELAAATGGRQGAYGRYIRIELPRRGTLTLAEVEVYSGDRNIARSGKATQINTSHGGVASRGIDGNKNPVYGNGGQTHCEEETLNPWWELDLGEPVAIERIEVYGRGEGFANRLQGFSLLILDEARSPIFEQKNIPAPMESSVFQLEAGGVEGVIRRAAMEGMASVRGRESETFELLSPFVSDRFERVAAIRALRRLPKNAWPVEKAPGLLAEVMKFVGSVPTEGRTSPAVLDAMEFGESLISLLPIDSIPPARRQLRELGVRVIRLGTLLERMSYDQEILVVEAGKPVEFIFENSDMMPHNLVITMPGMMEEIGMSAEATAQDPGAAARQYVPQSDKILLSSRLLQPAQIQQLSFKVPSKPGVYPYVCTYPGHWRRMYGAMYVVEDMDKYQADPEGYLLANKLVPQDELLKDRRPRTEWKMEDLAASVEGLKGGHSYGNGWQVFKVANCIACHKIGDVGVAIGPDLTKLDPKITASEILASLLEPSAKIEEKYQTYQFLTEDGQAFSGMVLKETNDTVELIENPLAKAEPVVINKNEIMERKKSPVSIMPKGLLDKLTREEILDLMAFLIARGDEKNAMFSGSVHDHHGPDHESVDHKDHKH